MRLILGTIQFGMDYGVSNRQGRSPLKEVSAILATAADAGLELLDTAALYGAAEEVLGRLLPSGTSFRIITKTVPLKKDEISAGDVDDLAAGFERSLERLRTTRVHGLLVHHAPDLLVRGGDLVFRQLLDWKEGALVDRIGVSVYSPAQARSLVERFPVDILQIPLNVMDQRFLADGTLGWLKARGVEVHARSMFLQGLLLMDPTKVHAYFRPVVSLLMRYRAALKDAGLTPVEAALVFSKQSGADRILVGVENAAQLREIVRAYRSDVAMDYSGFSCDDPAMIEPFRWKCS